jgi:hypothetical protein
VAKSPLSALHFTIVSAGQFIAWPGPARSKTIIVINNRETIIAIVDFNISLSSIYFLLSRQAISR